MATYDRRPGAPSGTSLIKYLSEHRLFGALPEAALGELAAEVIERTYLRGHDLYRRGDPASFVFVIKSGLAALTDIDKHGRLHPIETFSSGGVFGLATILLGIPRRFTASAFSDIRALLVPKDTFDRLYRKFPALAYQVALELAWMLYRSEEATFGLTQTPVASRLVRFLMDEAAKDAASNAGSHSGGLALSRENLAVAIGTSRETVTRVLSRLSRAGMIAVRKQQVLVLNPEQLARFL